MEKLVGITELSEILGINKTTLRALAKNGEIPSFKIGKQYRFFESDVKEWLRSKRT